MEKYTVYMHTTPDNKRFIGVTCRDPKKRWNGGSGYTGNREFYAAIRRFGWQNIKHDILHEDLTKEEAQTVQDILIKQYNTTDSNFGYNKAYANGILIQESRDRINKILREKAPGKKPCRCVETGEEFISVSEAARAFNVDRGMVSNSCNFNAKVHRKYTFEFIEEDK